MPSQRPTLPDGIAAQHGHIAAQIRVLRLAVDDQAGDVRLRSLLDDLFEDVRSHFAYEEAAMEIGGYPRLKAHRSEHAAFMHRLETLREESLMSDTELMPVLAALLETWFRNHEGSWDKEAAEFLRIAG